MRIAVGGILHETSTFATIPTRLADFESGFGIYRDQAILERFAEANMCIGGFLQGARQQGFDPVPLLWGFAYPSGLIDRGDYEALKTEFFVRLQKEEANHGPVDGVLLDLNGAMVIDGIEDGDGDMAEAVRRYLGPKRPLIVTTDLHGNHTQRRVEAADAIIGYDTYPHVDMAERGREAAEVITKCVRGEYQPRAAFRALPILWSAACQVTAHPPIDEAFRVVHEIEQRPGIITATLATGFPWADVPHMGASVMVVANGDQQLAERTADELADWIWQRRERWTAPLMSTREAIDAGQDAGRFPIMLADQSDNTGGGAPGDSTEVMRTMLELGLSDALLLYMVDPEVADRAHSAGVGRKIQTRIGAKSDPRQGEPIPWEAEVVALSDGRFQYDGPMFAGLTGDMGRSAWLRGDGLSVVVVHAREQPLDPAFARSLRIDCSSMKYIAVKSAVHFRSGFEKIAGSIYNVNAAGIHTHDFGQLVYRRATRPMYPLASPEDWRSV
ncbi:MAG: M81 family metallopeptidase [Planctomycetales bacterium]|nr:M81 family metallopeptidase [Planctomycetales bacterium]